MAQPIDQHRQENLAKMALRRKMLIEIEHIILEDYSYEEEILNLMDDYDRICDRGGKITFHGLRLTETYDRLTYLFLNAPIDNAHIDEHFEQMAEDVPNFVAPTETIKILKKVDVETPLEDCCGICYENHTLVECSTTQCGHCFGATCFATWQNTRNNGHMALTCPMCMEKVTTLTKYRPRKNYKKCA